MKAVELGPALTQALQEEHGRLLAPEVRVWSDPAGHGLIYRLEGQVPSTRHVDWRLDSFIASLPVPDPYAILEAPWRMARLVVDDDVDALFRNATADYMVRG